MEEEPLSLRLFGAFEVSVHGRRLPRLRTRSVEWLLALLALRGGHAVSRSVVAGSFWPESPQERALLNLRRNLVELRRALGVEAGRLRAPARDTLLLDLTGAAVDVVEFDRAIAAGDEESLRAAVALYRGPLLEGCCEEWALAERLTRAEACLQALEKLADRAAGQGDTAAALSWLRRAESLDPLRDTVQRRRMRLLAAGGDGPAACLVYREHRLRLHHELNVEPDPETTRLYQELRTGVRCSSPRVLPPAARAFEPAPAIRAQAPPCSPSGPDAIRAPASPPPPESERRDLGPGLRMIPAQRIPASLTALIGREQDEREVAGYVLESRLVTLIGGGGVGKTRLAMQVAERLSERFARGVLFVELASLADPGLLPAFVATALGIREAEGEFSPLDISAAPLNPAGSQREPGVGSAEARDPGRGPAGPPQTGPAPSYLLPALVEALAAGPVLLVLDNCEHLIEAAAALAHALLKACPELHILATSRQRLGLTGEVVWRVPSLPVPDPARLPADEQSAVDAVLACPSAQLFLERAAAARPGFRLAAADEARAVAQICSRLDGIPLAIELAAARVRLLPPSQIAARLDDRFHLLTGGSRADLPRHRTLRALIDWSYDLLPEAERALLRRLSVFAGGWTLEAAEAIYTDFGFRVPSGRLNFGLGPTSTTDRPEPLALSPIQNPNAQRAPEIQNPGVLDLLGALEEKSLIHGEEQKGGWRCRMLETVREYGREKLRESGEEEDARRRHLQFFLSMAQEAGQALAGPRQAEVLALLEAEPDNLRAALEWAQAAAPEAHLRLAAALWPFWHTRGYLTEGRRHLRAALSRTPPSLSPLRTRALLGAAALAVAQHDAPEAEALAAEAQAQFRALCDECGVASTLNCLGIAATVRDDPPAALALFQEALALARRFDCRPEMRVALTYLGQEIYWLGDRERGLQLSEESLALAEALQDEHAIAESLLTLGMFESRQADPSRARALLEKSLEVEQRLGHKHATAVTIERLADLAKQQRDPAQVIAHIEQALAIWQELGSARRSRDARLRIAWNLMILGNTAGDQGDAPEAHHRYEQALAIFREIDDAWGIACAANCLGTLLYRQGDLEPAAAFHREALPLYHSCGSPEGIAWSLERLAVVEAAGGHHESAAQLLGAASGPREACGAPRAPIDQAEFDQTITLLRAALGPGEYAPAWEEGREQQPAGPAAEHRPHRSDTYGEDPGL